MNTKKIPGIYNESIKKFPFLKYTLIFIPTILILSIIGYLNLKNSVVFLYAVIVSVVALIVYSFSFISKAKGAYSKFLLLTIPTLFVVVIAAGTIGFACFIFFNKPVFFQRWFPDKSRNIETLKVDSIPFPVSSKQDQGKAQKKSIRGNQISGQEKISKVVFSIQLSQNTSGYKEVYIDRKRVALLSESTRYNPRVELSNYIGNKELMIITNQGDTCISLLPIRTDSSLMRFVPNCD